MKAAWVLQGLGFFILSVAVYYIYSNAHTENSVPSLTSDNKLRMIDEIIIRSPAFQNGENIPSKYTCDGEDLSPPLAFDNVPGSTVSLVLFMDDPDAPSGNWDHWVVFNITPGITRIGEGNEPPGIGGSSSWGTTGYGGPCPPNGEHRYFFKVYALDSQLRLTEGVTKDEVLKAMEGHVISTGSLMGKYKRIGTTSHE